MEDEFGFMGGFGDEGYERRDMEEDCDGEDEEMMCGDDERERIDEGEDGRRLFEFVRGR